MHSERAIRRSITGFQKEREWFEDEFESADTIGSEKQKMDNTIKLRIESTVSQSPYSVLNHRQ